jgi:hypothetical protein
MKSPAFPIALSILILSSLGAGPLSARDGGSPLLPDLPLPIDPAQRVVGGTPPALAAARTDTVYLMGGPGALDGDFQDDQTGLPSMDGWTSNFWNRYWPVYSHVDTFHAQLLDPLTVPNHAMWIGTTFDNGGTPNPGYGNWWDQTVEWYGTVDDPSESTEVTVAALFNLDTEMNYDLLHFEVIRGLDVEVLGTWHGSNLVGGSVVPVVLDLNFTLMPSEYVGADDDQIRLRWRFVSDIAWSDEDGVIDTNGAAQIDNIQVTFDQGAGPVEISHDDFEPGHAVHWQPGLGRRSASYAQSWPALQDLDPCLDNPTPQLAFIDDGVVVPGTGGTLGVDWTYGPGGHVVHFCEFGDPYGYTVDAAWSPVLTWPGGGYDGAMIEFDLYAHFLIGHDDFYFYSVRSSADGTATWSDWYTFPGQQAPDGQYLRYSTDLSRYLEPGLTHIQISLGLLAQTVVWMGGPDDMTPAPYYDNVAVKAFALQGPEISTSEIYLDQDGFPADGILDWENLGANSVRFDMAKKEEPLEAPGDSLVITAAPVRPGTQLTGPPRMHWRLQPNPLFNPYRIEIAVPNPVLGDSVFMIPGDPILDVWSFDMPDTGFFYPGDILHYYFEAQDDGGGAATTLMPADTTGFSRFATQPGPMLPAYPPQFTFQALPTMITAEPGDTPPILFWNDAGDPAGEDGETNEWLIALANLGYVQGVDYDVYFTTGAKQANGAGLGARSTLDQISHYRTLLYTSGDQYRYTLGNGNYQNVGDDIGLLSDWLALGDRNWLAMGDDLAHDLDGLGADAQTLLTVALGAQLVADDVRPLIGGQTAPTVTSTTPSLAATYMAYGGCPVYRNFDAVEATGTGQRVLEYCDPAGQPSAYSYAAGIYNVIPGFSDQVVYLPYGMSAIWNDGGVSTLTPLAARTDLLDQILTAFGEVGSGPPTALPDIGETGLQLHGYPNPFNPAIKLQYRLPRAGHLEMGIYDLRGRLVRRLIDADLDAGPGEVVWRGVDEAERTVSAGVYFCLLESDDGQRLQKIVLVK